MYYEITVPYSEVAMHMGIAGSKMLALPVGESMAQLFTLDGFQFSFPITRGEAGLS